jgi:hypothetical protein
MPIVNVRFAPKAFDDAQIEKLRTHLPAIVAEALSDENDAKSKLQPSQISLEFNETHRFDVNVRPLRLLVFCEGFPVRLADIDDCASLIAEATRLLDEGFHQDHSHLGWVWIYPSPKTGFAEIANSHD